jgi:site-specific DNA recombinase
MAVALYARVSTVRQAEQGLSIPDQLRQLREHCKRHGLLIAQEYVEPGASATDDRRPIFQQLIADAQLSPAPFDAIMVHSLSRFFRDLISFGVYERQLHKHGVKVVSISQETPEDSSGQLARRIFSAFDEYQSQENSKHTARAMRENARQGFFNGSRAPFGYQVTETEVLGNRGRRKKRLAIHDSEAAIVREIYELYLKGHDSRSMGFKEIAKLLNARSLTMRGGRWGIQKIHKILSTRTYCGEFYYNVIDSKSGKKRPPSDWIAIPIAPVIDAESYERVRQRREGRRPSAVPARRLSSSILLTGLLKCGHCGAGMTLATGKSGKYRYYKCTNRASKGNAQCSSRNLPMQYLDTLVLDQLAERVFTAERLQLMLAEARRLMSSRTAADRQKLMHLQGELRKADERLSRLYEAVEGGFMPLDESLRRRLQQGKSAREAVLIEMASLRRLQALPLKHIQPSRVHAFSTVIRAKLRDRASGFARDYLRAVVDQIEVKDNIATISGSHARLVQAVVGNGSEHDLVPSCMHDWRARRDSNSRHPGS